MFRWIFLFKCLKHWQLLFCYSIIIKIQFLFYSLESKKPYRLWRIDLFFIKFHQIKQEISGFLFLTFRNRRRQREKAGHHYVHTIAKKNYLVPLEYPLEEIFDLIEESKERKFVLKFCAWISFMIFRMPYNVPPKQMLSFRDIE